MINEKIFINARFLTQEVTGVQRFAIEISKQIKIKLKDKVIFLSPYNILHQEVAKELEVVIVGINSGHVWEQLDLPLFLLKKNTLLINLANTGPVLYFNKFITLHDIAFIRYPETFSFIFRWCYRILIPLLLKTSKHILTVSDFSKKEISLFYNIPKDNISVVYNAVGNIFKLSRKNITQKYILAVSSITPHKNFNNLIKAYNLLKNNSVKLFLVGSRSISFNNADIDKAVNKNIIFKGRVNDEELIDLYTNAICFIHPSLYEGFGIPPLEAQACGTPVISSNAASLPEIGLDSFLYFDPNNIIEIKERMELLISNKDLERKLIQKGIENVKRFSWQKSANKIINML